MNKKFCKSMLLTTMLVSLLPASSALAANTVPVTLPTFDVTLNGTAIENENRQYPLLVYKDITYVPMTYHDCRFLGLETTWNQTDGLGIIKSNVAGAYYKEPTMKKNNKRATAQLVSGKVNVNGKQIHNAREPYPLLLYRDVTYFPLTWRYAVNEFGWQYNFNHQNGLVITSTNQKTDSLIIQDGRKEAEEYVSFDFTIDRKNLYYQGTNGVIYQRPLNDWNHQRKTIAQVPYEDDYYTGYPNANFYVQNGNAYYSYHSGGAQFGGDYLYRISDGKKPVELNRRTYDRYVDFGTFIIKTDAPVMGWYPTVPMTHITADGKQSSLGPSGYWFSTQPDSYDAKRKVLYTSACQVNSETGQLESSYLYAVNMNDNSLEKLSDRHSSKYAVSNDMLYYLYEGSKLYAKSLTTGEETLITSNLANSITTYEPLFAATDGSVFFGHGTFGEKLWFWDAATAVGKVVHTNGKLAELSSQNGYVLARFTETTDNHSRLLVFDANGKQIYTSSDVADKAVINENGVLVYRLAGTDQLVKVELQ